jgi:hypothetical protein
MAEDLNIVSGSKEEKYISIKIYLIAFHVQAYVFPTILLVPQKAYGGNGKIWSC